MTDSKFEMISGHLFVLREPDPGAPGYERTVVMIEIERGKPLLITPPIRSLTPVEVEELINCINEHHG